MYRRTLGPGEVHAWLVDLDEPRWETLAPTLSDDEAAKAARYRGLRLQQHAVRCRAALRYLLSSYVGVEPARVALRYGPFGRPELADGHCDFNLSHSAHRALVVLSAERIGVDLERSDRMPDLESLSALVLHPLERTRMSVLCEEERAALFYELWTQKESYCKALGVGLQGALSRLRSDPVGDGVACVVDETSLESSQWFLHRLSALDGYAASICTQHRAIALTLGELEAP